MNDRRLARLQAGSGLAFGTFLVLHLVNAGAASAGADAHESAMSAFRLYYRHPAVEIGAVAIASIVHAGCGLLRMAVRRRRDRELRAAGQSAPRAPRWLRAHRLSGYFLLLVFVGHVLATRGPSVLLDMEVDASYLTFSLSTWPVMFYPYYFLLFSCGTYHLAQGSSAALRQFGLRTPFGLGAQRPVAAAALLALALTAGVAGILGLGGVTQEVDESRFGEFRELYSEYAPFMANWEE